jgi:hypothetical protein
MASKKPEHYSKDLLVRVILEFSAIVMKIEDFSCKSQDWQKPADGGIGAGRDFMKATSQPLSDG